MRVPAFCLKWKTGWSFQERSPLSGGHAWAPQSAELCRKGQAGQENILRRTRSFEEAAGQAGAGLGDTRRTQETEGWAEQRGKPEHMCKGVGGGEMGVVSGLGVPHE